MKIEEIIKERIDSNSKASQVIFYSSIAILFHLLTNINEVMEIHKFAHVNWLIGVTIILFVISIGTSGFTIVGHYVDKTTPFPGRVDKKIDEFFETCRTLYHTRNNQNEITNEAFNKYKKNRIEIEDSLADIFEDDKLALEMHTISSYDDIFAKISLIAYIIAILIFFVFYFSLLFIK